MEFHSRSSRERILNYLRIILIFSATIGFLTIILEHGFRINFVEEQVINILSVAVVGIFVFYQVANILFASDKVSFLRTHFFEFVVILLILLEFVLTIFGVSIIQNIGSTFDIQNITFLYVVLAQIYIVIGIILGAIRYNKKILESKIHPARLFMLSFAATIMGGSLLLMLPAASNIDGGLRFIDALFTSTSAVCVTGLTAVDTAADFTRFGQIVVMSLFQIGGLGLMTFTTFFAIFLSGGLGMKEKFILREMMHEDNIGAIGKVLSSLIILTFVMEGVGATVLFFSIKDYYVGNVDEAVFASIFHAISAFCNAGFSIFPNNLMSPLVRDNYVFTSTVSFLIIAGGLGFTAILGLPRYIKVNREPLFARLNMSLQVKIVFIATLILIVVGTGFTYLLELNSSLKGMDTGDALFHAYFQAVSARTAGFNTIDITMFTDPTTFFYCFLMFIGASPGGTGGGIKTTTFTLVFLSILMYRNSTRDLRINKRTIPQEVVNLAFMIFWLSVLYILSGVFILSISEPGVKFIDLMFEAFSAAGTVGLSKEVSGNLSDMGKIIDILLMYIGRIGPLTIIFSFIGERDSSRFSYPKDNITML